MLADLAQSMTTGSIFCIPDADTTALYLHSSPAFFSSKLMKKRSALS